MRVLMISSDERILETNSRAREKMRTYADGIDALDIIVVSRTKRPPIVDGVLRIYTTGGGRYLRFVSVMHALYFSSRPDIVTAQDPAEHGFLGWIASLWHRAPLELQMHTDFFSPAFQSHSFLNRIRYVLVHFMIARASHIRVVSERIAAGLTRIAPDVHVPVSVIPVAMDMQDVGDRDPLVPPRVLVVSRLEPEKCVSDIFRAFARAAKEYPHITLHIVGDGGERAYLESLAKSLGVSSHVIFHGWVNDVASHYRAASVFVQASRFEGYGCSLMEAAFVGVPIVTTDVGVVGYEVPYDEVYCAKHTVASLAEGIREQLVHPRYPKKPTLVSLEETGAMIRTAWNTMA